MCFKLECATLDIFSWQNPSIITVSTISTFFITSREVLHRSGVIAIVVMSVIIIAKVISYFPIAGVEAEIFFVLLLSISHYIRG